MALGGGLVGGLTGLEGRELPREDWVTPRGWGEGEKTGWGGAAVPPGWDRRGQGGAGQDGQQGGGGDELQSALDGILNAGDGWTGPGVEAPLDQTNYTYLNEQMLAAGAGQAAPLEAWNYTPPGEGGGPVQVATAPAQYGQLPTGFDFGAGEVRSLGDDAASARYYQALRAIYDMDPYIQEYYSPEGPLKGTEWEDYTKKSWYEQMDDYLSGHDPWMKENWRDEDYRDEAVRYASLMGYYEDANPQAAARDVPVTPGGIWIKPRLSGNIGEIAGRYGLSGGIQQAGDWYWVPVSAGQEWELADMLAREGAVSYATPNLVPRDQDWSALSPTARAYQSWLYLHPEYETWGAEDTTLPMTEGYGAPSVQYQPVRGGW